MAVVVSVERQLAIRAGLSVATALQGMWEWWGHVSLTDGMRVMSARAVRCNCGGGTALMDCASGTVLVGLC